MRMSVRAGEPGSPGTSWRELQRCHEMGGSLLRCQYFVALGGEADMLRPTPIAGGACASSASIRLDVCVLDHLSPHAELNLDECCQLLRRAGKSLEAHVLEPCLNVWAVDEIA